MRTLGHRMQPLRRRRAHAWTSHKEKTLALCLLPAWVRLSAPAVPLALRLPRRLVRLPAAQRERGTRSPWGVAPGVVAAARPRVHACMLLPLLRAASRLNGLKNRESKEA